MPTASQVSHLSQCVAQGLFFVSPSGSVLFCTSRASYDSAVVEVPVVTSNPTQPTLMLIALNENPRFFSEQVEGADCYDLGTWYAEASSIGFGGHTPYVERPGRDATRAYQHEP